MSEIIAGTNITITKNAALDTLTWAANVNSAGISDFAEAVDDRVAALVVAGAGVTKTYDDTANTLTLTSTTVAHAHPSADVTDFAEAVDDRANALIVAGAGITKTYDDLAGTLTLASTATGATSGGWSSVIGVAGTALAGGEHLSFEVPFGCTLASIRAWSPVSGSATITVSRATYIALPTFTALGSLAISAANKAEDAVLAGWTATAIAAGDWLQLQVTGTPTTIDQLHVAIRYTRS